MKSVRSPFTLLAFSFLVLGFATVAWGQNPRGSLAFDPQSETIAYVEGDIGTNSLRTLKRYLREFPNTRTLLLGYMPGSVDDEANLKLAQFVRDQGLNTYMDAESEAYSGGTDLYLAGVERTMDCGAVLGVHAWATDDYDARDLPKDSNHPEHRPYIDYYQSMGLSDPSGFYFFTLDAAAAQDMHTMSVDEINRFELTSAPLDC